MSGLRLQHASMAIPHDAQESVRAFYGGILGLEEKQPPQVLAHLQLVWFAVGAGELELHFLPTSHLPDRAEQRHVCLVVDDLEEYRRRLSTAGVALISAEVIPYRPRFFCHDPFGNLLEFSMLEGDYRLG